MINECVIAHGVFDDKIILAKNRDRAYKASVSIVREIIDGVEVAYIFFVYLFKIQQAVLSTIYF